MNEQPSLTRRERAALGIVAAILLIAVASAEYLTLMPVASAEPSLPGDTTRIVPAYDPAVAPFLAPGREY